MTTPLNLRARTSRMAGDLRRAMSTPGGDLAAAVLTIARIEYPYLDPEPYLRIIERMGEEASTRIEAADSAPDAVRILNEYLYDEMGFRGNREHYDDPRNSFLDEVLERRTGIPISLAVVYLEVARRAGLRADGVNFPGHFLLRVQTDLDPQSPAGEAFLIVDPFHGGALLDHDDCEQLLQQHVGAESELSDSVLEPATRAQIIVRTLVNLKRLYVRMRSFPQAHLVSELLLAVDPLSLSELRDRGLLAYHLEDFAAALRDLESYLRLLRPTEDGASETTDDDQHVDQIAEQVKMLRRRVAGLN
jgi:regulator of sirC expression with transglutaminase-like and TPR domain